MFYVLSVFFNLYKLDCCTCYQVHMEEGMFGCTVFFYLFLNKIPYTCRYEVEQKYWRCYGSPFQQSVFLLKMVYRHAQMGVCCDDIYLRMNLIWQSSTLYGNDSMATCTYIYHAAVHARVLARCTSTRAFVGQVLDVRTCSQTRFDGTKRQS